MNLAKYEAYHEAAERPEVTRLIDEYKAQAWAKWPARKVDTSSIDLVQSARELPEGAPEGGEDEGPEEPGELGQEGKLEGTQEGGKSKGRKVRKKRNNKPKIKPPKNKPKAVKPRKTKPKTRKEEKKTAAPVEQGPRRSRKPSRGAQGSPPRRSR